MFREKESELNKKEKGKECSKGKLGEETREAGGGKEYEDREYFLSPFSVFLQDSLWAGVDLHPMPHIHTYQCPTPYCSCHIQDQQTCETLFYQEDPGNSRQCHGTRRGKLI